MIPLTKEQVQRFAKVYEKEFAQPISDADAEVMMQECLQLFQILLKPLPDGLESPDQDTAPSESLSGR